MNVTLTAVEIVERLSTGDHESKDNRVALVEGILRFDRIKFNDWQEAMRDE